MPGAFERYLNSPEPITPNQITKCENDIFEEVFESDEEEFYSYLYFYMRSQVNTRRKVVVISQLYIENEEAQEPKMLMFLGTPNPRNLFTFFLPIKSDPLLICTPIYRSLHMQHIYPQLIQNPNVNNNSQNQ